MSPGVSCTKPIKTGSNLSSGSDKRGVIVYVYTWGDNGNELKALEDGRYGCYYK
jgi:hypothetical protein